MVDSVARQLEKGLCVSSSHEAETVLSDFVGCLVAAQVLTVWLQLEKKMASGFCVRWVYFSLADTLLN